MKRIRLIALLIAIPATLLGCALFTEPGMRYVVGISLLVASIGYFVTAIINTMLAVKKRKELQED